jgi:hypothetical protein
MQEVDYVVTVFFPSKTSGGLRLQRLDAPMQLEDRAGHTQGAEGRGARDHRNVQHGSNTRSRSRSSHPHGSRSILEEGDQDVDGHPHPTRDESTPQHHFPDTQVPEILPLAFLSGSRSPQGRPIGQPRNHRSRRVSAMGEASPHYG